MARNDSDLPSNNGVQLRRGAASAATIQLDLDAPSGDLWRGHNAVTSATYSVPANLTQGALVEH